MPDATFPVPVTREHIAAGQPGDPHRCAIAQALTAALKLPQGSSPQDSRIEVTREAITIREGQLPVSPVRRYQTTQMVANWIDQYDVSNSLSRPRPFTLLLNDQTKIARWQRPAAQQ